MTSIDGTATPTAQLVALLAAASDEPLLVRHGMAQIATRWWLGGLPKLVEEHSAFPLDVTRGAALVNDASRAAYRTRLGEFSAGLRSGRISATDYVFRRLDNTTLASALPELPDLFARVSCAARGRDYCTLAPEAARGTTNVAYGGDGSRNGWHVHGAALNGLVAGAKRWSVRHPSSGEVWACWQAAGDLLWVPDGFRHAVLANRGVEVLALATQFVRPAMPALAQASYAGLAAEVRALLDAGADVDEGDGVGSRALHAAASEGHVEIATMLLAAGAAAGAVHASEEPSEEVPPLHLASRRGRTDIVRRLLQSKATVDAVMKGDGSTALHHAAASGHADTVRVLYAAGASVEATAASGATALQLARLGSEPGHREAASILERAVAAGDAARLRALGWSEVQLARQGLWTAIPSYYRHDATQTLAFANARGGLGDPHTMDAIYRRLEARPSDVHIVTYPKAGTSWIAQVAWLVTHGADIGQSNALTSDERTVFVELRGSPRGSDKLAQLRAADHGAPRQIKWHHRAELLPADVVAAGRVIYLLRNPKDTVVSWYHMQRRNPLFGFTGSFDEFFELFLRGDVAYGSWVASVRSWWVRRHQPNVLLLTYEHLHRDLPAVVRRVAAFLKVELSDEQLAATVFHCSFEQMKVRAGGFMRKGEVGDWRNWLSDEQSRRMDEWVEAHAKEDGGEGLKVKLEYSM